MAQMRRAIFLITEYGHIQCHYLPVVLWHICLCLHIQERLKTLRMHLNWETCSCLVCHWLSTLGCMPTLGGKYSPYKYAQTQANNAMFRNAQIHTTTLGLFKTNCTLIIFYKYKCNNIHWSTVFIVSYVFILLHTLSKHIYFIVFIFVGLWTRPAEWCSW